jgi:LacI family transcriptional regulator
VPKNVGFIGFSNSDHTDLFNPPLTVIKQPAFAMGETATKHLLQIIESKRPVKDFETTVFDGELILRSST